MTLVKTWKKLLPDLEDDDIQGFPKEEIKMSQILDMVCYMRSFENINKEMLQNGYNVKHVKWASST